MCRLGARSLGGKASAIREIRQPYCPYSEICAFYRISDAGALEAVTADGEDEGLRYALGGVHDFLLVGEEDVGHLLACRVSVGEREDPGAAHVDDSGLDEVSGDGEVLAEQDVTADGRFLDPLDVGDALRIVFPVALVHGFQGPAGVA